MNKINYILLSTYLLFLISSSQIEFNLKKVSSKDSLPKTLRLEQTLSLDNQTLNVLTQSSLSFPSSPSDKFQTAKQIVSDIDNYYNFQYLGTLGLGSNKQPFTFIFDTGSNELWFPTTECHQCPAGFNRFDTSKSQTYKRTSDKEEDIQYGKGRIVGYPSEEQVWFTDSSKIDNMPCLAVTIQQDLYGTIADGILGLAPLNIQDQPPFLLDLMKQNGLIDERKISFSYNDINQDSVMVFGKPNDALIPEGAQKISVPIEYRGILYFIRLQQITYGGTQLHYSNVPALIDTGTSLLAAPVHDVGMFLTYIITTYGSVQVCQGGSVYCIQCSKLNKEQDMIFDLQNGQQARVGFNDLWRDLSGDGMCDLMMIPIQSDMWILGDIFIRRYYTVLDYDNGVVEMYDKLTQLSAIQFNIENELQDVQNQEGINGIKNIEWIALTIISILIAITLLCMCKHLGSQKREVNYYSKIILLDDDDVSTNYSLLDGNERNNY